jgi:quercetin dioxygenase-like cupin family protein
LRALPNRRYAVNSPRLSLEDAKIKLAEVFAVLKPDLSVETIPVTPTIFEEMDSKFEGFKNHLLVSEFEFTEDWPTWEQHPAGDEIVVLLTGQVEIILRKDGKDERIPLSEPGSYIVIPAGTWHTAKISMPTRMLFITPGEGTEDRSEL